MVEAGPPKTYIKKNSSALTPSQTEEYLTNAISAQVHAFHKSLPDYAETRLIPLPALATALGIGALYIKDESLRFGLPSFKILGASWGVYRAVAEACGIEIREETTNGSSPEFPSLAELGKLAKSAGVRIVTCTDGNWGRAVSRVAAYVGGIDVIVYVPAFLDEQTRANIRSEGDHVHVLEVGGRGEYDDAVQMAILEAKRLNEEVEGEYGKTLLLLDTSFPGYVKVPSWVTQGYETMLSEVDSQLAELTQGNMTSPHVVVSPVGVGSLAHAVVLHYKSSGSTNKIVTVEPDTAASLLTSLQKGKITEIETSYPTIMAGMNCGTTSTIAWPYLQSGVDVATSVSDRASHDAVGTLFEEEVTAGPCGAAGLAALWKLRREFGEGMALGVGKESTVVVFSTEGVRDYEFTGP